jgi:hypothetical protein
LIDVLVHCDLFCKCGRETPAYFQAFVPSEAGTEQEAYLIRIVQKKLRVDGQKLNKVFLVAEQL